MLHHFRQRWSADLCDRLNAGGLPRGYYALIELSALRTAEAPSPEDAGGGLLVATTPPQTRFVMSAEKEVYVAKANRISVRHPLGDVVAVLEIVSPGNKDSRAALSSLVAKSLGLLSRGVNLLIVDLLPPTKRDPEGIHGAIWTELEEGAFALPPDKPLTLASYAAGPPKTAYVEPVGIGDPLPNMPLFLGAFSHVQVPLEETYERTWSLCPQPMREHVLQLA